MTLKGWIKEEEFYTPPERMLTDQEIYDREPDRTDAQARLIVKLMAQNAYAKIEEIHHSYKPKSNGKISIGMASKIINQLIKK